MRIRPKTQLAFLLIGLLPLLTAGWLTLHQASRTLAERVGSHLNSISSIQQKRVESLIVQNLERLNLVRSRTQLRINLARHNQTPQESHRRSMLQILTDAKRSIPGFHSLSVIGLDGRVVVSTDPDQEGRDLSSETLFREGLHHIGSSHFSTDTNGNLITLLSGPLILDTTVGVLLIEASGEGFLSVAQSYDGLGLTGETILLLRQGDTVRHLTPFRFSTELPLHPITSNHTNNTNSNNNNNNNNNTNTHHPLFHPASAGTTPSTLQDTIDYRGTRVLATFRQIDPAPMKPVTDPPEPPASANPRSISLVTKIDYSEAFAPVHQLRRMGLLILAFTLAAVLLVSFLLSNSITRPLRELARTTTEISNGNLDKRANVDGNDEITLLARDFNTMARGLTEANRHLEEKVASRTRELESIRERYALAVKGSTDGLWDWNILTNTVSYSDRFKELLGYGPGGFKDLFASFETRLHPEDREATLAAVKAHLEEDQPYDVEYRLQCKDNTYRWFRSRGSAVRDAGGKPIRMAGSISDITDRHVALEKLKQSNHDLEQFAYVASHDLQEPLRMISSYLSLLQQRHGPQLDSTANEFIGFAVDGASRMQRLIEDLLHYARVDTKTKPPAPTESRAAVETAIAHLSEAISNRSASVHHENLPLVNGDLLQLTQLFQNLIGNAIKFCPPDRTPVVRISAEEAEGRWLFRVSDNGIGIEPRNQQAIFEIFRRLHAPDEYDGTGIGLAVCQKIVSRHGGRIWVESELNQGSTFCFTLPKPAQPPAQSS